MYRSCVLLSVRSYIGRTRVAIDEYLRISDYDLHTASGVVDSIAGTTGSELRSVPRRRIERHYRR